MSPNESINLNLRAKYIFHNEEFIITKRKYRNILRTNNSCDIILI